VNIREPGQIADAMAAMRMAVTGVLRVGNSDAAFLAYGCAAQGTAGL
jgi:hypothetical protein